MKRKYKLAVYWSKRRNDLMINYPLGQGTKSDAHWLSGIFGQHFEDELRSRGYDMATFKFEICPIKGNCKFASERVNQSLKDDTPSGAS